MVSHTKGWDCCNHVFAKTNVHAKLSRIAQERDHQRRAEFVDNIQQYNTAQLVSSGLGLRYLNGFLAQCFLFSRGKSQILSLTLLSSRHQTAEQIFIQHYPKSILELVLHYDDGPVCNQQYLCN